jgi:hypothetical protein
MHTTLEPRMVSPHLKEGDPRGYIYELWSELHPEKAYVGKTTHPLVAVKEHELGIVKAAVGRFGDETLRKAHTFLAKVPFETLRFAVIMAVPECMLSGWEDNVITIKNSAIHGLNTVTLPVPGRLAKNPPVIHRGDTSTEVAATSSGNVVRPAEVLAALNALTATRPVSNVAVTGNVVRPAEVLAALNALAATRPVSNVAITATQSSGSVGEPVSNIGPAVRSDNASAEGVQGSHDTVAASCGNIDGQTNKRPSVDEAEDGQTGKHPKTSQDGSDEDDTGPEYLVKQFVAKHMVKRDRCVAEIRHLLPFFRAFTRLRGVVMDEEDPETLFKIFDAELGYTKTRYVTRTGNPVTFSQRRLAYLPGNFSKQLRGYPGWMIRSGQVWENAHDARRI